MYQVFLLSAAFQQTQIDQVNHYGKQRRRRRCKPNRKQSHTCDPADKIGNRNADKKGRGDPLRSDKSSFSAAVEITHHTEIKTDKHAVD